MFTFLAGAAVLLQAVGEGAAVQSSSALGSSGWRTVNSPKKGDLLAHGGGGQKRHRDRAVQVALAGDDIAHGRPARCKPCRASRPRPVHGRPALGGYRLHVVGLKDPLVQKYESVYLLEQRRGQVVHFVAGQQQLRAFFQLGVVFRQNLVVLVNDDSQIDRHDLQAELLHQLALVEDHGAEGLGPHAHLSDAHAGEVFHHAADGSELPEALGEGIAFHGAGLDIAEGNVEPLQLGG